MPVAWDTHHYLGLQTLKDNWKTTWLRQVSLKIQKLGYPAVTYSCTYSASPIATINCDIAF